MIPSKSTNKLALLCEIFKTLNQETLNKVTKFSLNWEHVGETEESLGAIVPVIKIEFKEN